MGARPLTALGIQMRDALPPVLRDSNDYLAIIHALSRELERLEDSIEVVRAQLNPSTADVLLNAWEWMVKLPVGGAGETIDQRRAKVIGRLRKLLTQAEGQQWVAAITDLIGGGWTYEEHIPGDGSSPPADTLRITLPFAPDTDAYDGAVTQIRELTPAHLDIAWESAGGFILDESELDRDAFGS